MHPIENTRSGFTTGATRQTPVWTAEQIAIINSTGNIAINAVAGSGKTTTLIEYAASRPGNARILYLAFNKSVKLEAARKFESRGLHNVKVETAHSLAYKHIVPRHGYNIKAQPYRTHEIAELLNLQGNGEKHGEYVIANHINKFITYFCNSDKVRVQELNYLDTVFDNKAKAFVKSFYKYIEDSTRLLLAKMDKGEIEITHDFYLKKFQLTNPVLPYDHILFDEGQDASAAMLDVFLKQKAVKVIVGDIHQQIYSWRHAVNSLAKTDFDSLHLSTSFRFPQYIAQLAAGVLLWKNHLHDCKPVSITGKGRNVGEKSKATIARTNLGLLLKAIAYITDNRKVKHIYFEGNINSYTYADDGASLYDVLSLSNNSHDRIRDKLVKSMNNLDELEEYIEKTEDVQLSMMVELVKEYGNEIPGIIKSLKELHTGDEERARAEMIFSTVHRAKGMEYDIVYLANDFIPETKLEKLKADKEPLNMVKWNEEINLLYVAITRAKHKLYIPETLVPKDVHGSRHIQVVKTNKGNEKTYTVVQKREVHKDAYQPWTPELDRSLKEMYDSGATIGKIAARFGRTKGAIYSRLKKLDYWGD